MKWLIWRFEPYFNLMCAPTKVSDYDVYPYVQCTCVWVVRIHFLYIDITIFICSNTNITGNVPIIIINNVSYSKNTSQGRCSQLYTKSCEVGYVQIFSRFHPDWQESLPFYGSDWQQRRIKLFCGDLFALAEGKNNTLSCKTLSIKLRFISIKYYLCYCQYVSE